MDRGPLTATVTTPRVEHTGESYLVVSGHDGTPDHLRRMLAMASDMLAAVQVGHVY